MSSRTIRLPLFAALTGASLVLACSTGSSTTLPVPGSSPPVAVASRSPGPSVAPSPAATTSPPPSGTPAPVEKGAFTIVAGTETFAIEEMGTVTTENGVTRGRAFTVACVDVANDPRVSGTTTETWNFDFNGTPPDAGLDWGTRRLVNEEGAWEGIVLGAAFPGHREELTMWLDGSGGYEGLTYYMHVGATASPAMTYPFEGIIYEGTIPIPTFPGT